MEFFFKQLLASLDKPAFKRMLYIVTIGAGILGTIMFLSAIFVIKGDGEYRSTILTTSWNILVIFFAFSLLIFSKKGEKDILFFDGAIQAVEEAIPLVKDYNFNEPVDSTDEDINAGLLPVGGKSKFFRISRNVGVPRGDYHGVWVLYNNITTRIYFLHVKKISDSLYKNYGYSLSKKDLADQINQILSPEKNLEIAPSEIKTYKDIFKNEQ